MHIHFDLIFCVDHDRVAMDQNCLPLNRGTQLVNKCRELRPLRGPNFDPDQKFRIGSNQNMSSDQNPCWLVFIAGYTSWLIGPINHGDPNQLNSRILYDATSHHRVLAALQLTWSSDVEKNLGFQLSSHQFPSQEPQVDSNQGLKNDQTNGVWGSFSVTMTAWKTDAFIKYMISWCYTDIHAIYMCIYIYIYVFMYTYIGKTNMWACIQCIIMYLQIKNICL